MKDRILAKAPTMRLTDIRGAILLACALSPAADMAAARQHQTHDKIDDADSTHDTRLFRTKLSTSALEPVARSHSNYAEQLHIH
jgi:hypothetical protein